MTRRLRKPQIKPNKVYPLKIGFKYLQGMIKIKKVYHQRLGDMRREDIAKEGFATLEDFKRDWIEIYHSWDEDMNVWVVEFEYLPLNHFKPSIPMKNESEKAPA